MTRIVLAPAAFKGTATARDVGESIARGIHSVMPAADVSTVPVADGGSGTVDAALAAGYERVTVTVSGPLPKTSPRVRATLGLRGGTAVIELAAASGLALLGEDKAPLDASSRGTGELISAALDRRATTIILGVGDSSSTDGGTGLLRALGARFLDRAGAELRDGGGALLDVERVDLGGLDPRLDDCRFVLASDVDSPLLGREGAATVFGPQKGADPDDVALLEAGLGRLVAAFERALGPPARELAEAPGAGAAGGVGYATLVALGATRASGVEVVLSLATFDERVRGADLVVTGEGRLDTQTLRGKAPLGVLNAASACGVPVVVVAGEVTAAEDAVRDTGFARAYDLTELGAGEDPPLDPHDPDQLAAVLEAAGARIAHEYPELTTGGASATS